MLRCLRAGLSGLVLLAAPVAAADGDGSAPGDDQMTCQDIAMALMPYAQQMRGGSAQQLGRDAQEMQRRAVRRQAELAAEAAADTATVEAGCVAGINATCAAASEAVNARQQARNAQIQAEDKPITDQMGSETADLVAQGQAMQQDPRLMHLMHLAEEKHCH